MVRGALGHRPPGAAPRQRPPSRCRQLVGPRGGPGGSGGPVSGPGTGHCGMEDDLLTSTSSGSISISRALAAVLVAVLVAVCFRDLSLGIAVWG